MTASEDIKISANLAGVEIRTLAGIEDFEVSFSDAKDINDKLSNWNNFLNTGNRALEDRDEWIEEIYDWIKKVVDEYGNEEVTTIKKLYKTSSKNAWIEGLVFPFINIPFQYKGDFLGGFYEYYDDKTRFSDKNFYFDFLVQRIHFSEHEELLEKMENKVNEIFKKKGYNILNYDE